MYAKHVPTEFHIYESNLETCNYPLIKYALRDNETIYVRVFMMDNNTELKGGVINRYKKPTIRHTLMRK